MKVVPENGQQWECWFSGALPRSIINNLQFKTRLAQNPLEKPFLSQLFLVQNWD